jgi:spore maturation protein SpmB
MPKTIRIRQSAESLQRQKLEQEIITAAKVPCGLFVEGAKNGWSTAKSALFGQAMTTLTEKVLQLQSLDMNNAPLSEIIEAMQVKEGDHA